jgi:NAD(P)H dehydrogenase (quinone)
MTDLSSRILVTGATGQLGRLVIESLLKKVPAAQITAAVRNSASAAALASRGVDIRIADYAKPETLTTAFKGIDQVLLISSNALGQRLSQHRNVIDAAKAAGVKRLAYTSVLHADDSPLGLAEEHRQTESAIRASGVPYILLRNGWYTENYAASIPTALAHSAFLGSAGEGRISSASRADYADAAAAALTSKQGQPGKVYELAGDEAFTLTQFAAEIAKQSGKSIAYKNLPEADFKAVLLGAGLPEPVAELLANSDTGVSKGALFDDSRELSKLIGRPTTPFATTIAAALKK